ncbi:hypothetical protein [Nonomuraea sp. CA-141351]|uniref:hypothetical protein n=1 Tax=Nonomuraea sp. CA-141351 TaxID=3239996 RepID=UPI003D909E4F
MVTAAYAASVRALIAGLATLNQQVAALHKEVEAHLGSTRPLRSSAPSPDWEVASIRRTRPADQNVCGPRGQDEDDAHAGEPCSP